jgi:hypothetical protein
LVWESDLTVFRSACTHNTCTSTVLVLKAWTDLIVKKLSPDACALFVNRRSSRAFPNARGVGADTLLNIALSLARVDEIYSKNLNQSSILFQFAPGSTTMVQVAPGWPDWNVMLRTYIPNRSHKLLFHSAHKLN